MLKQTVTTFLSTIRTQTLTNLLRKRRLDQMRKKEQTENIKSMVSGFSGGQNPVPRGTATQPRILAPPKLPKPYYPYVYKLLYMVFIFLSIFHWKNHVFSMKNELPESPEHAWWTLSVWLEEAPDDLGMRKASRRNLPVENQSAHWMSADVHRMV